jgi:hypothetical protein
VVVLRSHWWIWRCVYECASYYQRDQHLLKQRHLRGDGMAGGVAASSIWITGKDRRPCMRAQLAVLRCIDINSWCTTRRKPTALSKFCADSKPSFPSLSRPSTWTPNRPSTRSWLKTKSSRTKSHTMETRPMVFSTQPASRRSQTRHSTQQQASASPSSSSSLPSSSTPTPSYAGIPRRPVSNSTSSLASPRLLYHR